jgi:hypothetical protein
MRVNTRGAIAIWHDVIPEAHAGYIDWHSREHMPERMAIPGFERGRRAAAIDADLEYLTLYETTSFDVTTSAAYRTRLDNPTPGTTANVANFRGTVRSLCSVLAEWECGEGGLCTTWRFAGENAALVAHARHMAAALPEVIRIPGVSAFRVLLADDTASHRPTAEKRLRERADGVTPYTLVVESFAGLADLDGIHEAVDRLLPDVAGLDPIRGSYRTQLTLRPGPPRS